jgi:ATP-dependent Clp protease ATP-binding subunit ClpA
MFERFVPSARAVVADAQLQARGLGHPFVGTEHLLLALIVSDTPAGDVLRAAGLTADGVTERVRAAVGPPALEADRAALAALGIDLDQVRESVESTFGPGALAAAGTWAHRGRRWRRRRRHCSVGAPTGRAPFSPRAKKCLELSLREALRLGHRFISTEHVALGIVREGEGMACLVMASAGVSFDRLRAELEQAVASPTR